MQAISFRCAAKSDPDVFRMINVGWPGSTVTCDCSGYDGTLSSHTDATLIAGERAMAPQSDRSTADEANGIPILTFEDWARITTDGEIIERAS